MRLIAQKKIIQRDDSLRVQVMVFRKTNPMITDHIVHRRQPGRAWISQIQCLDGRRFAGQDRGAVIRGMARQVDQNVNMIGSNLFGQAIVGPAKTAAPIRGQSFSRFVVSSLPATGL